ncbi:MAG: hypothetical protein EBR82_52425 [Caulobacteraceae bacterium]|nr:hypothetical protein [Caulobacteraceae bacterium]
MATPQNDKFDYFPGDTKDPMNKYVQPKNYTSDMGEKADIGYPNNIANTQTMKTRGTGAAQRGNKNTTKMG